MTVNTKKAAPTDLIDCLLADFNNLYAAEWLMLLWPSSKSVGSTDTS
jgi:hypothetical protein